MLSLYQRLISAEWTKLRTVRSTWVVLPVAALLGIVATLVMCGQAVVARELLHGTVRDWEPVQVVHWIRLITSTLLALWALVAIAGEQRAGTLPLTLRSCQRPRVFLLATWLVTGAVAAVVTALTVPLALLIDKLVFPSVTGTWALGGDVLHLLWSMPLYSFLICGLAVGLGALSRSSTLGIAVFLLWQFVAEPFSLVIPYGARVFAYLPFTNGSVLVGEDTQFPLPVGGWAPAALCLVVWVIVAVAAGSLAMRKRMR